MESTLAIEWALPSTPDFYWSVEYSTPVIAIAALGDMDANAGPWFAELVRLDIISM